MTEKFKLMYYETECGYIEYDKIKDEFKAVLYNDCEEIPFLLFGFYNKKTASDKEFRLYLEAIVIPETRENINDILNDFCISYYNKWEIYKKLYGRNTFDDFWIKSFN